MVATGLPCQISDEQIKYKGKNKRNRSVSRKKIEKTDEVKSFKPTKIKSFFYVISVIA